MRARGLLAAALLGVGVISGCSQTGEQAQQGNGTNGSNGGRNGTEIGLTATARLYPTEGNEVTGVVTFTETGEGVRVVANLQGLSPGPHGFHVHEYGDCSALDAESAGGHFNPTGMVHGAPTDTVRHAGDLGNIEGMPDGTGHYEWVDPVIELRGENSIIGRAVVVHANPDDLSSQPAGNAGERLACGLIEVDRPQEVSEAPR